MKPLAAFIFFGFAASALAAGSPPVGLPDSYTVAPGKKLRVSVPHGVLRNDSDPEHDPLTAILAAATDFGVFNFNSDGSFNYISNLSSGSDTFSYWAFDGTTVSNYVTVSLKVDARPVALEDSWGVVAPGRLAVAAPGVLANDFDFGDAIFAELMKKPSHGTLLLRPDGSFVYVPIRGFLGDDFFIYRASDGKLRSSNARVVIHVVKSNRAPTGRDDVYRIYEDDTLNLLAPGVMANDTDPDGQVLRAELLTRPGPVDNFEFLPDGSFFLQPAFDWDSDLFFTYRITDGIAFSAPITVTIDIIAVNDPPIGQEDAYELDLDYARRLEVGAPGVLANDYDPVEFDVVTVSAIANPPAHGALTLRPDGSFSYTPVAGFTGFDGFSYWPADSTRGNLTFVSLYIYNSAQ